MRHHRLPDTDYDAIKIINPYEDQVDGVEGIDFDLLDAQSVTQFIIMALEIARLERLPINLIVIDVLVSVQQLRESFESVTDFARNRLKRLDCV
jgi:hypothetical protein